MHNTTKVVEIDQVREKLVELIRDSERKIVLVDLMSPEQQKEAIYSQFADFLIAEGVFVLPCNIGDTVYRIDKGNYYSDWQPFIQELTVTEISRKKEKYGDKDLGFAIIANGIRYKFSSIGKSVFLTLPDAEKALEEKKGEIANDK